MLKTKLFKYFAVVVIVFSLLTIVVGMRIVQQRVIDEAQTRVRLDLSSAWALFNSRQHDVEIILRLVAAKEAVVTLCESRDWDNGDIRNRLERIRTSFGLDFLALASPDGQVRMRTRAPYRTGDYRSVDVAVAGALRGEAHTYLSVMSREELALEGEGLADRAFLQIEDTPRARRTPKTEESRGMVMISAVPVRQGTQVLGVAYGGILINRNFDLVDHIRDVVFRNEVFEGMPAGTATIFLDDSRIATTVLKENGNRALGTRASKEVADRVLDNGSAWVGEAFVVREKYLTAYEPIRDGLGQVIGMLYVGILKRPFDAIQKSIMLRFAEVSLAVLLFALILAFIMAGRLAYPIHRLVEASESMITGHPPGPVNVPGRCGEIETLIQAFNQMTAALAERENRLKALNRSYMETLGFVTHELKGPVATMMNYIFLMREGKLGDLTEKQMKALRAIDAGGQRLVEMVRHYLNLSRIENGEFRPVPMRVRVCEDVLTPLLSLMEPDLQNAAMHMDNKVSSDLVLHADLNMVREIFENLLGNAIKYGRSGGTITITADRQKGVAAFVIRNEGEGIPAEKLPQLFQKFSRVDTNGAASRQKGTGLGLFITQHIVNAHGGHIEARSQPGAWAEFAFTLPLEENSST